MTNCVVAPFSSSHKTARLVEAASLSRGSMYFCVIYRKMATGCVDKEMNAVMDSYMKECDGE